MVQAGGDYAESDFIQRNFGVIPNLLAWGSISKCYMCSFPERIDAFQRAEDRG